MCEKQLFDFMHNGDRVNAFTGSGTSDVFYRKNGGSSRSAGMYYKADRGIFVATSGKTLSWNEAESRIRDMLWTGNGGSGRPILRQEGEGIMTFYSQNNIGELTNQDLIARCVQIERLRNNPRAHGMSDNELIDELNRYHDVLEARGMSFNEQRTRIDGYLRSWSRNSAQSRFAKKTAPAVFFFFLPIFSQLPRVFSHRAIRKTPGIPSKQTSNRRSVIMMYPTSNLDELHDDALIARCVGIEKERNRIFDGRRSEYSAEALCSELGMYSRLLEARGMSFSEQRAKINRQLWASSKIGKPSIRKKDGFGRLFFQRSSDMTEMELFRFKYGDEKIVVFSPGGTAPVFYRKNGGEPQEAYAVYKESRGKFVDDKGNELGYRDAIEYVRGQLWH